MDQALHTSRPTILHIDDEQLMRLTVGDYLRDSGYAVLEAASAPEGLRIFREHRPDVVITDLRMPDSSGHAVVAEVQDMAPETPVIILSGTANLEEAMRTLRGGAHDFIPKPVREMKQIRMSVESALEKARLRRESRLARENLENEVCRQTKELRDLNTRLNRALETAVGALNAIVAQKDPYTAGHNERVARIAVALGQIMGLGADRLETLRLAANLHDIGKVNVPAKVLNKPGRLTPEEFAQVQIHPQAGYDILKNIPFSGPVAEIVLQHHERQDGAGYPRGLCGEEILLEARILAVADVYEALTSNRPYRTAASHEFAMGHLVRNAGAQLCLQCVCAFLAANKTGALGQSGTG